MKMTAAGSTTSIGIITTGDYMERAQSEVLKYFTTPTAAPNPDKAYSCLSGISVNMLTPGNTVNLQRLRDYEAGGMERAEMKKDFKKVIQWMGSKRKADQTRILTIDSKQRVGQAISPEFGFSLMTGEQYTAALRGAIESDGITNPLLQGGADEGDSAEPVPPPPGLAILAEDDEEIDYADVFPSAMATAEWSSQQSGAELMDAFTNIAAGFEMSHETEFLTQMVINTKRDFMHSTLNHPARSTEANFTAVAVIQYLIEQATAHGGYNTPEFEAAAYRVLNSLPISIQAAGFSISNSSPVRSSIKG